MKEFDYDLDYENIDFSKPENRRLYRIGRGEQGVFFASLILTITLLILQLDFLLITIL